MMPAAKMMDPVMGVDIHIIQPPGPVPPIPVPHPFIGMLIDPMDFVPIVGATILVNGMPRAIAGTAGKALPPHIPIGGMFVKPPSNECEMFMGSATVVLDGDPASYMALPALSCQDIGMPAPPRSNPKKKTKTKSLVLPTSVVLPIPAGLPVLIGGPPTISMMAMGMKAGMAGMGKALKKLKGAAKKSRRMAAVSKKMRAAADTVLTKVGVPPTSRVRNKVNRAICAVTGHPVDLATGKVFTDTVDFELSGPAAFRFERVWYSTSVHQGPLGHGWHHSYDMALAVGEGVVGVRLEDGRGVVFPDVAPGESAFDRRERLTLLRDDAGYVMRDEDGVFHRFAHVGRRDGTQAPVFLQEAEGRHAVLRYDSSGLLTTVVDGDGRDIGLAYDDAGRIVSLNAPHPDVAHERVVVARFAYGPEGDLIAAYDALGNAMTYEYADHLLVREADRSGFAYGFHWEGAGVGARCVYTSGDGGLFERWLSYDDQTRTTMVTDRRGAVTTFLRSEDGVVTHVADPLGRRATLEWDDDGYLVGGEEFGGATFVHEYDERGRLTGVTDAMGHTGVREYDGQDRLVAIIDPLGNPERFAYDERGNTASYTNPLGLVWRYEHDDAGRLLSVEEPFGRTFRHHWSPDRRSVELHDAAGLASRIGFDRWGRVVEEEDRHGQTTRLTYSLRGELLSQVDPDGGSDSYEYDRRGLLVAHRDVLGRVSRFAYSGAGAITAAADGARHVVRYEYEPAEESLVAVVNERGERSDISLDTAGRPAHVRYFDGRTMSFEYDAAGNRSRVVDGDTSAVEFTYDANGSVLGWRSSDGAFADYGYDPLGRLVLASNAAGAVEREYDAVGNILREAQVHDTVTFAYNALGQRVRRTSTATGRTVHYSYDAVGRLARVADAGSTEAATAEQTLAYSDLGELAARTFGDATNERYEHDASGNVIRQVVVGARGQPLVERRWARDAAGDTTVVEDAHSGVVRYEYAADETLRAVRRDDRVEVLDYDPAGNVTFFTPVGGFGYGTGNRLLQAGDTTYDYDAQGRVVGRADGGGASGYVYDGAGRMIEARLPGAGTVLYEYDALGRRVLKTVGDRETRFFWDDHTLLGECTDDGAAVEYACVPGFADPMLMWIGGAPYHFVVDPRGVPHELLDAAGAVVWRGRYGALGQLTLPEAAKVAQPLRMEGQYHDAETGLDYNLNRYYDSHSGRFTTPDPFGFRGGLNLYSYGPNTVNWSDPFGLMPKQSGRPSGSPSSRIKKRLKRGDFGHNCEACGRQTVGPGAIAQPQAEHYHPDSILRQEEGFDKLTKKNQQAVRNLDDNFGNLCQNCNGSRGNKSYLAWNGHPDHPTTLGARRKLHVKQKAGRKKIRAEIKRRLKLQGCT